MGAAQTLEFVLKQAVNFLSSPGNALSVAALFLASVCLLLYLRASYQLRRFRMLHQRLWEEVDAPGLERWVLRLEEGLSEVRSRVSSLEGLAGSLSRRQRRCLQRVGMVRYNAFSDVGGELSFSLALLDEEENGVVISGLYGREESRIYAKPIKGGKSPINLSEEEREALRRATGRGRG